MSARYIEKHKAQGESSRVDAGDVFFGHKEIHQATHQDVEKGVDPQRGQEDEQL